MPQLVKMLNGFAVELAEVSTEAAALMLKTQLGLGVVKFSYRKSNGENRVAYGTCSRLLIPQKNTEQILAVVSSCQQLVEILSGLIADKERQDMLYLDPTPFEHAVILANQALEPYKPKEEAAPKSSKESDNIAYYDLEQAAWRSLKPENILSLF